MLGFFLALLFHDFYFLDPYSQVRFKGKVSIIGPIRGAFKGLNSAAGGAGSPTAPGMENGSHAFSGRLLTRAEQMATAPNPTSSSHPWDIFGRLI